MWLFFDEAVPAALARKLGSHILTETMERRPDIGFDSYDRLFPNQDTADATTPPQFSLLSELYTQVLNRMPNARGVLTSRRRCDFCG